MTATTTNAIPWRLGQMWETVFSKDSRLWALQQRTARLEQYQMMQHAITQIIARSTELNTALPNIIQTICEAIGWDLGEVWHVDRGAGWLLCEASWHNPSLNFPVFGKSGLGITFARGKGLPGRVWATEKPAWIKDVVVDANFPRAPLAECDGLHTGLGIPIRTDGAIIGVIAFFSRSILTLDRDLLHVLDTIGSQVGLFIERKRIEQIEYAQARKLAAIEERQRLARDLHDSVTQTLFSANVIAEMLPQVWNRNPEQMNTNLDELQRLTRGALAEMRTLLVELRPAAPHNTDLTGTLRHLADSVTNRSTLQITLEISDKGRLAPEVQMTLYRIVQEALNNIIKHASATHVWVQLCTDGERIKLTICDDGRGFKPDVIRTGHLGLGIMRERAEEIGARFELNSAPGMGTSLIVSR
ncbi:MAG: GAF domain-containing sensor histidine kinase [Aggregatilineales bacterium]